MSAHNLLTKASWQRIRGARLDALDGTCSVCSTRQDKGMVCHEVWQYDDDAGRATLVGLTILCSSCNFVQHIGRAGQIGQRERAMAHMIAVNGMTDAEAGRTVEAAFEQWRSRSARAWTVAVAPELVDEFPELAALTASPVTYEPKAGRRATHTPRPWRAVSAEFSRVGDQPERSSAERT